MKLADLYKQKEIIIAEMSKLDKSLKDLSNRIIQVEQAESIEKLKSYFSFYKTNLVYNLNEGAVLFEGMELSFDDLDIDHFELVHGGKYIYKKTGVIVTYLCYNDRHVIVDNKQILLTINEEKLKEELLPLIYSHDIYGYINHPEADNIRKIADSFVYMQDNNANFFYFHHEITKLLQ